MYFIVYKFTINIKLVKSTHNIKMSLYYQLRQEFLSIYM